MKERPILFNAEMVRTVLDGTKTQTRRVIKPDWWICLDPEEEDDRKQALRTCPYGVPGDRLWVRETWYCDDGRLISWKTHPELIPEFKEVLEFRASHDCRAWEAGCPCEDDEGRSSWRPSIHMPRWASRITLEVTAVRVERVQEISEADALSEGVDPGCGNCGELSLPNGCGCSAPEPLAQDAFIYLWDTINAKRGYSWESNPWVWVVEFKVV